MDSFGRRPLFLSDFIRFLYRHTWIRMRPLRFSLLTYFTDNTNKNKQPSQFSSVTWLWFIHVYVVVKGLILCVRLISTRPGSWKDDNVIHHVMKSIIC